MLEIPVSLERKDLRTRLVESLAKMRESGGIDHEVARLLDEWTKEKEEAVPANQPERNKPQFFLMLSVRGYTAMPDILKRRLRTTKPR